MTKARVLMSLAGLDELIKAILPCPVCNDTRRVRVGHYLRPEAQGEFGERNCAACRHRYLFEVDIEHEQKERIANPAKRQKGEAKI